MYICTHIPGLGQLPTLVSVTNLSYMCSLTLCPTACHGGAMLAHVVGDTCGLSA